MPTVAMKISGKSDDRDVLCSQVFYVCADVSYYAGTKLGLANIVLGPTEILDYNCYCHKNHVFCCRPATDLQKNVLKQ